MFAYAESDFVKSRYWGRGCWASGKMFTLRWATGIGPVWSTYIAHIIAPVLAGPVLLGNICATKMPKRNLQEYVTMVHKTKVFC